MKFRTHSATKKIVSGFSILAATLALVGCGNSSNGQTSGNDNEKVEISFSAWDKLPDSWFSGFRAKYPNISVKLIQVPDSDYSQKVNQMVVGNTAPDVMLLFETDLPKFAKSGAIDDLDTYIEKNKDIDTTDFIPAVSDLAKATGGNYGLPWAVASEIMYYNKDMFDAQGVSYPTDDWTWDDFSKAAEKLTKTDGGKTTQWGADALTFRGLWWSLAGEAGDKIVSDGTLSLGDGLKDALAFQNKLTNELQVSPQPAAGDSVSDLFASGQAAMTRTGSWMTAQYKDLDFNWDIATLPKDKQSYNSLHTGFYTINSQSKKKDAAWKFISYMMSEEGQKSNSEWGGNPSALKSIAAKGYQRVEGKKGPSNWDAIDKSLEQGRFGYVLVNASATTNLVNQFDAYLLGTTSINAIFDKYIPEANQSIKDAE